jgi:hypothetical protein
MAKDNLKALVILGSVGRDDNVKNRSCPVREPRIGAYYIDFEVALVKESGPH